MARYCDYYGNLSYKDFLILEAAGTLDDHAISARTDLELWKEKETV